MPARYFFHADAPSRDVYGPVPLETVRRWRAEGRLRDDSKLKAEGADAFTTAREVLAAAPPPEPVPEAAPEIPLPPRLSPSTARREAIPVSRLLANTLPHYWESLRKLWWIAAVTQIPAALLTLFLYSHMDEDTYAIPARAAAIAFLLAWPAMASSALGFGFMALTLHEESGALPLPARLALLLRRAFPLLWTFFLRLLLIVSLGILFLFCVASAHALPAAPILRLPLYFFASLSGLPALILTLRYLPSPLIVLLEGKKGLAALRRSGELVRFNQGNGLISPGDFRLFLMLLPLLAFRFGIAFFTLPLVAHIHLTGHAKSLFETAIDLGSSTLTLPLYTLLLLAFFLDARPRVPDTDKDAATDSEKTA